MKRRSAPAISSVLWGERMAHSFWRLLAWAAVVVISVTLGLGLSVVVPCAWMTGSLSWSPGLGVGVGPGGDALRVLSGFCRERLLPFVQESFSAGALEQHWHRWLRWTSRDATIRRMVGRQSQEDVEWFAAESWGERLSAVPVWQSPSAPDYSSFWREYVSTSVPLLIRSGAQLSGWDRARLPWRREWLESINSVQYDCTTRLRVLKHARARTHTYKYRERQTD